MEKKVKKKIEDSDDLKKHSEKSKSEKEETEKEDAEKGRLNMSKDMEKQLVWTIVIIAFVILSFVGTYWLMQDLRKFDYAGAQWEKIKYGGTLKLYHGRFQIPGTSTYYNIYMRNDPRNNNIPVGNISFKIYPKIILATSYNATICQNMALGNLEIGKLFGTFNVEIDGRMSSEKEAKELKLKFANCSYAVDQNVILIQTSETPSIEQDKDYPNCYIINVGKCENVPAVERFLTAFIAQVNEEEL